MKKLEFKTSKGEFILEEASDKHLGRVLVKHMTEEQFADVVDTASFFANKVFYKNYGDFKAIDFRDIVENSFSSPRKSFESLIKSLGWNLFENPELIFSPYDPRSKTGRHEWHEKDLVELKWKQAESKTLYNPILLNKL